MKIKNQLQNRTAIKYNHILMENKGKLTLSTDSSIIRFGFEATREMLNNGSFSNIVTVLLSSESGSFGPDFQPSPLRIKRLQSLLNGTSYRVVQQKGQSFTIEGEN